MIAQDPPPPLVVVIISQNHHPFLRRPIYRTLCFGNQEPSRVNGIWYFVLDISSTRNFSLTLLNPVSPSPFTSGRNMDEMKTRFRRISERTVTGLSSVISPDSPEAIEKVEIVFARPRELEGDMAHGGRTKPTHQQDATYSGRNSPN